MRKSFIPLLFAAAAGLAAFAPSAAPGGWATITADRRPDSIAVGQTLDLGFIVKQHGVRPMNGLKPRIEANAEGQKTVRADAKPAKGDGRYAAQLQFPAAAEWFITIHSGFANSYTTLSGLRVVGPRPVARR